MEKTYAAGVKRFGYESEISPVFRPPSGIILAKEFTIIVKTKPTMFNIWYNKDFDSFNNFTH